MQEGTAENPPIPRVQHNRKIMIQLAITERINTTPAPAIQVSPKLINPTIPVPVPRTSPWPILNLSTYLKGK